MSTREALDLDTVYGVQSEREGLFLVDGVLIQLRTSMQADWRPGVEVAVCASDLISWTGCLVQAKRKEIDAAKKDIDSNTLVGAPK